MISIVAHMRRESASIHAQQGLVELWWKNAIFSRPVLTRNAALLARKAVQALCMCLYLEENKKRKKRSWKGHEHRYSTTRLRLLERLLVRTGSLPIRGLKGEYCVKLAMRRLLGTY